MKKETKDIIWSLLAFAFAFWLVWATRDYNPIILKQRIDNLERRIGK